MKMTELSSWGRIQMLRGAPQEPIISATKSAASEEEPQLSSWARLQQLADRS